MLCRMNNMSVEDTVPGTDPEAMVATCAASHGCLSTSIIVTTLCISHHVETECLFMNTSTYSPRTETEPLKRQPLFAFCTTKVLIFFRKE